MKNLDDICPATIIPHSWQPETVNTLSRIKESIQDWERSGLRMVNLKQFKEDILSVAKCVKSWGINE